MYIGIDPILEPEDGLKHCLLRAAATSSTSVTAAIRGMFCTSGVTSDLKIGGEKFTTDPKLQFDGELLNLLVFV